MARNCQGEERTIACAQGQEETDQSAGSGSGKWTRSLATLSSSTSAPARANAPIISSTSHSGDDALAVRPSARTPVQHRGLDVGDRIDQERARAAHPRNLDQPVRIRALLRADDQHRIADLHQFLDGILAILGRVADVVGLRRLHRRETLLERLHDLARIIDAERGLRDRRDTSRDSRPARSAPRRRCRPDTTLPGATPSVPFTSSWPAWPIRITVRPSSSYFSTSRWTLVTSGQVASITRSSRSLARSHSLGATPCALKMTRWPVGTSSRLSTKIAPSRSSASSTKRLCTI